MPDGRSPVLIEVPHRYDATLFSQIVHEKSSDGAVVEFRGVFLGDNSQRLAEFLGFNNRSWFTEFVSCGVDKQFSKRIRRIFRSTMLHARDQRFAA